MFPDCHFSSHLLVANFNLNSAWVGDIVGSAFPEVDRAPLRNNFILQVVRAERSRTLIIVRGIILILRRCDISACAWFIDRGRRGKFAQRQSSCVRGAKHRNYGGFESHPPHFTVNPRKSWLSSWPLPWALPWPLPRPRSCIQPPQRNV